MNVYLEKINKYFANKNKRIIIFSALFFFSSYVLYRALGYLRARNKMLCKNRIKDLIKLEIAENEKKFIQFESKKQNNEDQIDVVIKILKSYNYRITDDIITHYKEILNRKESNNQNESIRDLREFSWLENTSINYTSFNDINLNIANMSKPQTEFYYFLYMKICSIVNKDIIDEFHQKRMKIFNSYIKDNKTEVLSQYIECCLKIKNIMKEKDNEIHSEILDTLLEINYCKKSTNEENIKNRVLNNKTGHDVNLERIKKFYYEDCKDVLPISLDFQKTFDILIFLFEKSKENIGKIKKIIKNEEELHYIAEQLALDETCIKYDINENIIKKAFVVHNISFDIVEEVLSEKEEILADKIEN